MTDTTLRVAITNSLNELSKLKFVTRDPEQLNEIRSKSRILIRQLDVVLGNALNKQNNDFQHALESLNKLTKKAKKAKSDVDKIGQTIQQAADAITKVETVLGDLSGLL